MIRTTATQKSAGTAPVPSSEARLQRKCACGAATSAGTRCAECAAKDGVVRRRLAIGASHDPLEREADRVAERVVTGSALPGAGRTGLAIQRATGKPRDAGTAPPSVDHVVAGQGQPLEPVLRQDMEQRFGHDFSRVRIHTGGAAEQSARDVGARAYTVGTHVVFGASQFAPAATEGRRLLAHELTHVVQQGGSDRSILPKNDTGDTTLQAAPTPFLQRAACPCCADSISIGNISKIDTTAEMGHSFDVTFGLSYPASGPSGRCELEWWEKTNVPAIPGHTPNTWTDMYALYPQSPTFDPWKNRVESCGSSSPATITDPPALGKRPGRTVTRTLEFRIVVNSMPATSEGGCDAASQQVTAKQVLTMVNGAADWTASSFTTP